MANVKVGKKGLIIFIAILLVIGLGVGLFFILKPKPDLEAPYNDTYVLVHSEDFAYVKSRNAKIEEVLTNRLSSIQEETYQQTKAKIVVYNQVSVVLDTQNEIYLDNLKFTENKGEDMAKLQQEIKKNYSELNDNIAECKKYLETYLTNQQINEYTSNDALYQKVYNYKFLYEKLINSQTKYYEYMSKIFANYLSDTISVNKHSKMTIQTTASWARKITEYYLNYKEEEMTQFNFAQSISKLQSFANTHKADDVLYYVDHKADCDVAASNFANLNFDDCINALATYKYDEFIASLEGAVAESATALKSYFLV